MLSSSFQKEEAMQPFTVSIFWYPICKIPYIFYVFNTGEGYLYENGGGTYNFKCSCISKFMIEQDNLLLGFRTD